MESTNWVEIHTVTTVKIAKLTKQNTVKKREKKRRNQARIIFATPRTRPSCSSFTNPRVMDGKGTPVIARLSQYDKQDDLCQ